MSALAFLIFFETAMSGKLSTLVRIFIENNVLDEIKDKRFIEKGNLSQLQSEAMTWLLRKGYIGNVNGSLSLLKRVWLICPKMIHLGHCHVPEKQFE
jgi:hypothetical protein